MHTYFKTLIQEKTNVKLHDSQYEELENLYTYLINRPQILNISKVCLDVNISTWKMAIYVNIFSELNIITQVDNYIHVYNYSLLQEFQYFLIFTEISKNTYYFQTGLSEYQKVIVTAFICTNTDYMNTVIQYLENKEVDRICDILKAFNHIIK